MIKAVLQLMEQHEKREQYVKDKYYYLQFIHLCNKLSTYCVEQLKQLEEAEQYD